MKSIDQRWLRRGERRSLRSSQRDTLAAALAHLQARGFVQPVDALVVDRQALSAQQNGEATGSVAADAGVAGGIYRSALIRHACTFLIARFSIPRCRVVPQPTAA